MGGVRYTSASGNADESPAGRIVNFVGFPVSGQTDSNALACCLYVWNSTANMWEPMTQP